METTEHLTVMAMCLSRYDREVGAAVLEPTAVEMEQVKEGGASRSLDFLAIAVVDPRRAGSLIDRIPVTSDLSVNSNWSRIRLAEMLASPPEGAMEGDLEVEQWCGRNSV